MIRFLHKHGVALFFAVACFLLAVSLGFSVYSFARFVSAENPRDTQSGVAGIQCEYDVNNGTYDSFINAPFILQLPGTTRPVQMNPWAESVIRLRNGGTAGLAYEYGFVFYMPQKFAEKIMFQMAELQDGDFTAESTDAVVRASDIFRLNDARTGIVKTETTSDGQTIPNDYADLIASGGFLRVDTEKSSVVLQEKAERTAFRRTYGTYETVSGDDESSRFVCPLTFTDTDDLMYYRITVNITREADRYILHDNDTHYFLFRLVLRDSLSDVDTEGEGQPADDIFAATWNVDDYWKRDADGNYIQALQIPEPSGDYECRWLLAEDKKVPPRLQLALRGTDVWQTVSVRNCVGIGSPCRIHIVFTQTM